MNINISQNSLKPSQFNLKLGVKKDSFLLFNGTTGGVLFVPAILSDSINALLSVPIADLSSLGEVNFDLAQMLLKGGFLIPANKDEIAFVADRFKADITENCLNVTLCTTLACNLNCRYCYQTRKPGRMSFTTANAVIDHLENKLRIGGYRELDLDWFGGEPLLTPDLIDHISDRLITISEQIGVEYSASIVTNGTLIPRDLDDFLNRNRIFEAQVTLDGPPDIHNRARPFKNGDCSFNEVVLGVRKLASRIPVTLRLNIDTNGLQSPEKLIDMLENLDLLGKSLKVYPYPAPVAPLSTHCAPSCGAAMTSDVFFSYLLNFQKALLARYPTIPLERIMEIPKPLSRACGAQSNHSLTIHPSGAVFKCGLEVHEPDKAAGTVNDRYEFHQNYRKWVDANPLDRRDCKKCSFLPVCMGGCPKFNFQEGYKHERESCNFWHQNFPKILPVIAAEKMPRARNNRA